MRSLVGSGKSVLTKHERSLRTEGDKFSFFFSRMGDTEDNNAESFAYGLLSAISLCQVPMQPFQMFQQASPVDAAATDRVWCLIEAFLSSTTKLTIFIDALDECSSDSSGVSNLLARLDRFQDKYGIRVWISCRPEPKLLHHWQDSLTILAKGDKCNSDVAIFICNSLDKSYPASLQEALKRKLSVRANGNFQIARMLLSEVQNARTTNRALDCIDTIPEELSQLYQHAIDDFDGERRRQDRIDRSSILTLIFGARQAMTISQISVAFSLKETSREYDEDDAFDDPEGAIQDLCYPFVTFDGGTVGFTHITVKEFLSGHLQPSTMLHGVVRLSDEDSNMALAKKCLACLLLDRYRSSIRIGGLLHRNFDGMMRRPDTVSTDFVVQEVYESETDSFYEYAARNWIHHLTALNKPDAEVLLLANEFINCVCFVHWSEYVMMHNNELNVAVEAKAKLTRWRNGLPQHSKDQLDLQEFFWKPYTTLATQYRNIDSDKELQWLTDYRLAAYLSLSDFEKSEQVLHRVVQGLITLLGEANPLTLRAKVDWARMLLVRGQIKIARKLFTEAWEVQRELLTDSADAFVSLQLAALTSYYMLDFEVSDKMQKEAHTGLSRVLGDGSYHTLCSTLFLGYARVAQGQDELALQDFQGIYDRRSAIYGHDDGLAVTALIGLGQSQRVLGRRHEAVQNLKKAWEVRSRLNGPQYPFTIDAAVHLAIAYREDGNREDESRVLGQIDVDKLRSADYSRYCQVMHLNALMDYDMGAVEIAILRLERVIFESSEDTRWLHWARLSLAAMMIEEGREKAALVLFDNIVREKGGAHTDMEDLSMEPSSPKILRLALEVTNLVRRRQIQEAEARLEADDCEWVWKEGFWIPVGGPVAETGLMRGPWPE